VRRYLKLVGWRWRRPRLAPATHAPGQQKKRDPAATTKLAAIAAALATSATVLFLDECELQLLPVVRAMWMKGPRVCIPTPGQNAKRVLFGALDARTGALVHLVRERKRALDFVAFLDHLASRYPCGPVVLVVDNVVTHDAKLVRAWLAQPAHGRFQVRWLPKYAAHEHNPIERVWGLLKDHVAANRLHGSIAALVEAAERYLRTTAFCAPHPPASAAPVPVVA
jgi:transposase